MNLAYLRLDGPDLSSPPGVVVHGQGGVPVDRMVAAARGAGVDGPVVVPFGNYATTASGMEVGGPCWYRSLPGDAGTDPLTLTRAVVQLADLLADVGLERPVLFGWRQGAAVALGTALLDPAGAAAVIAVDPPSSHLGLLPAALSVRSAPPAALVTTGEEDELDPSAAAGELARRGMPTTTLVSQGEDGVAGVAARFLSETGVRGGAGPAEGRLAEGRSAG